MTTQNFGDPAIGKNYDPLKISFNSFEQILLM